MGSVACSLKKRVLALLIFSLTLSLSNSFIYAEWTSVHLYFSSLYHRWGLSGIYFTSPNEGWAVGSDPSGGRGTGVLLHYLNGSWIDINPPTAIPSWRWGFSDCHFTSSNEGWAVGEAYGGSLNGGPERYSGVIFHYSNGSWTSITPPSISLDWGLSDVYFSSPNEGWAVGYDHWNHKGVLVHYSNGTWTSIIPPNGGSFLELHSVHFTSSNEGWAVGDDRQNNKGALLHYSNGSWTLITPPDLVSSYWWLSDVHFTSPNEGWAVGENSSNKGALLHYYNNTWESVTPPDISLGWRLYGVHFTSSNEGWAVGEDWAHGRGVLLHYFNGSWTFITPPPIDVPNVTSNWYIESVHFTSPNEGWAVGYDRHNYKGVLLRYSETVSSPNTPIGGTNGVLGTNYTYSTSGSTSSSNDPVQYLFDWGDQTNSGWLPVGQASATKSWSSTGTFQIKVKARCSIHTSVESIWSEILTIAISAETVSTPSSPVGSTIGVTEGIYNYSTGGSSSNFGHSIEYRFDWGDGTYSSWSSSASASKSWPNIESYTVKAQARCATHNSIVSDWSSGLSVTIVAETVSTPNIPSGPTMGTTSKNYTYSTAGSTSNLGHTIQYQFDWMGNGSNLSSWGSATQSRTWTNPGIYNVRARARCTQDTSIVSNWSDSLPVSISVPKISVTPTTYGFGNVKMKRSKTASFKVANNGTANLSILASTITGTDASMFKITSGSGSKTIKPGKTLTIKVTFKPTSKGSKSSTLMITSNDPDTPTIDILLSGIGQ